MTLRKCFYSPVEPCWNHCIINHFALCLFSFWKCFGLSYYIVVYIVTFCVFTIFKLRRCFKNDSLSVQSMKLYSAILNEAGLTLATFAFINFKNDHFTLSYRLLEMLLLHTFMDTLKSQFHPLKTLSSDLCHPFVSMSACQHVSRVPGSVRWH